MANDLVHKPAHELAALVKTRQVSSVELTKAYLERIAALNPKVNAFITVTDDVALARAREADTAIAAGKYLGPLHGIPYAPKDILATKGIRTTNGSKLTADWVPDHESTVTARLNRAGAVMVGKLNLLEFAMGSGVDSGFGPARNPWDLAYSPSGSSSGSGAALIADMVPLSIGTDTGGSIRGPAANCGIVGLKQTYGRVSRYGVTTLSWTLDHAGPMTRSVADAAAMLQAIAGADPKDSTAARRAVPDYAKAMTGGVKGVRVGVPKNYFFEHDNAEVDRTVRAAIAQLKEMGAIVVEVEVPHANLAGSAGWIVAMAEAACFHEKRLREKPGALRSARARAARGGEVLLRDRLHQVAAHPDDPDERDAARLHDVRRDGRARQRRPAGEARVARDRGERRAARIDASALPRRQHVHRQHDRPAGDRRAVRLLGRSAGVPDHDDAVRPAVRRGDALPREPRVRVGHHLAHAAARARRRLTPASASNRLAAEGHFFRTEGANMDEFDNGMGMPDEELMGGSLLGDVGAGGLESEPESAGAEPSGHRASGGARAHKAAGSAKKAAPKAAPKAARKAAKPAKKARPAKKAKPARNAAKKAAKKPARKAAKKGGKKAAKKSRKAGKKR